eukprot:CAMPEP_0171249668 /NCGR_PEP_ID=MMETSP0790-20130122/49666_1 /TAXON_ID=2925 /ORGANISM="Alexandrium catenella, Strain OF101" /LENGTH=63 /DNA_ID=CAMNT_0011717189 /DNA_START=1 /DNA_END=188 /DNA_ORIENTATION=+
MGMRSRTRFCGASALKLARRALPLRWICKRLQEMLKTLRAEQAEGRVASDDPSPFLPASHHFG